VVVALCGFVGLGIKFAPSAGIEAIERPEERLEKKWKVES
jgi:hypothetical protein